MRGAPTGCPPTEWFGDCAPTQDSVLQLLEAHYRVSIPNFWAIIAPATENWYYILGDVQKGASPSCGEYAVAGTGTSIFRGLVNETRLREGDISIIPVTTAFTCSPPRTAMATPTVSNASMMYSIFSHRSSSQMMDFVKTSCSMLIKFDNGMKKIDCT